MASQTLRTLKLSLLADVSDFGKGMGKAGSDFQKFSRSVETASRVATGVIGAIGGLAVSAINAASDLSETQSAIEQVFGPESARQLNRFARNAATSLGQSQQQALSAAQTFGIFGQAAGLSGDELVDFTTDLITLAGDLASFNNTTVDQAITALGAALRGESEPIRNYGVLLDAASVKARAVSDGIIENSDAALSNQQRTLAVFSEILSQTQTQQGDFERTSEGLANSQRTFRAQLENFRADVGNELLPVLEELLPKLRGVVDNITDLPPERIVQIGEGFLKFAAGVVALNAALKGFAAVQGAYAALTTPIGAFAAVVGGGAAATVYAEQNLPTSFGTGGIGPTAGLQRQRLAGATAATPAGGRPTGNVTGRMGSSATVVVNGIVGSPYQVYRELERATAAGNRSGIGSSRNFR